MTVYFIDSHFRQKATATTKGKAARITDDTITQNVNGLASCELEIAYTGKAELGDVGEYIYIPSTTRRDACFFQIITKEVDYINKTVSYYGDTNFLWFNSQVANDGTYGRVSEVGRTIEWYLDEFTTVNAPFNFHIGTNEIDGKTAIGDTNATTAKEALDKTAALFNCTISFAFVYDGKTITPYIDIYSANGGADTGEILTVGKEINELIETVDCSDVATAVKIRGHIADGGDDGTTTNLPEYDSGDYYTNNGVLFSRSAWYRFGAGAGGSRNTARFGADIILQAQDLETTDAQQVLNTGLAMLEEHKEPSTAFSCKCSRRVSLGGWYTIVVPGEEVYITARCLEIQESKTRGEFSPTFGNFYKSQNAFEVMAKNAK